MDDERYKPATEEERQELKPIPCVPQAYGPICARIPAAVSPSRISVGCLQNYQIHATVDPWRDASTGGKFTASQAHSQWLGLRGALFLHRRLMAREILRRGLWFPNRPLDIPDFHEITRVKAGDIYVPIIGSKVVNVLDSNGRLTLDGFNKLEDTEFVWPYLDEIPKYTTDQLATRKKLPWIEVSRQFGYTYAHLGKEMEKPWDKHFIGGDSPGDPNGPRFATLYVQLLKECGRAGSGTRLSRWADHWLERAEKIYSRIYT